MRNRTNYSYTPAQGDVSQARPIPSPRRAQPPIATDRLLMILFFICAPFFWVLSWMWHGALWFLFLTILGAIFLLWMRRGFTARGRMSMTGLYSVFAVLALSGALRGAPNATPAITRSQPTIAPILSTSVPVTVQNPVTQAQTAGQQQVMQQTAQQEGLTTAQQPLEQQNYAATNNNTGLTLANVGNSACEQVLAQYLEYWKTGIVESMVELSAPSWRAKQENTAKTALYWLINGKKLDSYAMQGSPSGMETDTARTISLVMNTTQKNTQRSQQFNAIVMQENNQWYVDPDSLKNGKDLSGAVASADGSAADAGVSATPTPVPGPTATPKPGSKTKLYYNAKGGKYYHAEAKCSSVEEQYLPLKSFTYGQLSKTQYKNLLPCSKCKAPSRP